MMIDASLHISALHRADGVLSIELQQALRVLLRLRLPLRATLGEDGLHLLRGLRLTLDTDDGEQTLLHINLDEVILLHR